MRSDAEDVARLCVAAQERLSRAGRALHDDAGGLLAAAGLRLQMMEEDYPAAAGRLREVSAILEQAIRSVRAVSQDLSPSPVYRVGLRRALERLEVALDYRATAPIPPEAMETAYNAAAAAIDSARKSGAPHVNVRVRGTKGLTIRIEDDGAAKHRARALGPARLLARVSGLGFSITTGKRTIVLIQVYALRRPTSR
jgi:signal transduction histidine kinase